MGIRIVYLDLAIFDLKSIHKYISEDSKRYAALEVKKIKLFIDSLSKFPSKGKYYQNLKGKDIYSIVFRNYIIFYTFSKTQVSILSIHHHSRFIANNPAFKEEE